MARPATPAWERFWRKVRIGDGCWEWAACTRRGYGALNIDGKLMSAHRWSFTAANGEPRHNVLHRCNNKLCVRPSHLYDGSAAENSRDMALDGGHPWRKLTWEQAEWVRENADAFTHRELAKQFGVDKRSIGLIIHGKTYKHEPVETEKDG